MIESSLGMISYIKNDGSCSCLMILCDTCLNHYKYLINNDV